MISNWNTKSVLQNIEAKNILDKRDFNKLPPFYIKPQTIQIRSYHSSKSEKKSKRSGEKQELPEFENIAKKLEIHQKSIDEQIQKTTQRDSPSPIKNNQYKRKFQDKNSMKKQPRKVKYVLNKSLIAYYRHNIISLCALFGKKDDFMNFIRNKKIQKLLPPLTNNDIEEILKKQVQSKGKDKGRQNFNIMGSEQLKSLKYKKKVINNGYNNNTNRNSNQNKAQKQQDQEEEQNVIQEEKIDNATWRRRNNVRQNQKVFIIKGGYQDMRKALLDRGWFQNQDVWSPFFDLKWTTKINDVEFYRLSPIQIVNHFNNNQGLTSKFGLARNLRTLILTHNIDIDKFFPRCYDIGDLTDFQNFIQNFKFGFAQTIVKRFLVQPQRYHNLELKLRIAIDVLERRLLSFKQKIDRINNDAYFMITADQWGILTETSQLPQQILLDKLKLYRKEENQNPQMVNYEELIFQKFRSRITNSLQTLKQLNPQLELNGYHNIWIAKPNFLSRGRGIRCFNNLFDIMDYCFGKDIQYVVQKYIQNPLIIYERKFDIRQWVLIQDYNPPKIWFFQQSYVRFCTEEYSLENIHNRFIHLTNNSIQKYSSKFNKTQIAGNMWSMKDFSEYIGIDKWKIIQQKMKNIIVWSVKSCQGQIAARKNSCQLVGYDFMIDQDLNPWLIEINMSPAMDYSTQITKRLVKIVMQDTIKVIVDSKKKKDTGMFSCIYKGEQHQQYKIYKI